MKDTVSITLVTAVLATLVLGLPAALLLWGLYHSGGGWLAVAEAMGWMLYMTLMAQSAQALMDILDDVG